MKKSSQGLLTKQGIGVAIQGNMATLPVMDQQYVQLKQQMVKLKRENITLYDRSGMSSVRKPEQLTIEPDETDRNWPMFIDSWIRDKEMCRLTNKAEICNELRR